MTWTHWYTRLTHQTRKPFFIAPCRQKNPASRENYAFELQVVILRLSRVFWTSREQMVNNGRVYFMLFQNINFLCIKNWGNNKFCVRQLRHSLIDFTFNKLYRRSHLSYTLDDTFIVDFSFFSSSLPNKVWVGCHSFDGRVMRKGAPYRCIYKPYLDTPILVIFCEFLGSVLAR